MLPGARHGLTPSLLAALEVPDRVHTPLTAASSEGRTGRAEVSTLPQGRGAEAGQPPLLPGRRRWRCTRGLQGHGLSRARESCPCFLKLLCRSLSGVIFLADFAQQYNSCSRAAKRSRKWNLKCRNKIIVAHEL